MTANKQRLGAELSAEIRRINADKARGVTLCHKERLLTNGLAAHNLVSSLYCVMRYSKRQIRRFIQDSSPINKESVYEYYRALRNDIDVEYDWLEGKYEGEELENRFNLYLERISASYYIKGDYLLETVEAIIAQFPQFEDRFLDEALPLSSINFQKK